MAARANRVLEEERKFIRVGARCRLPEVLNVIARDLVRVGAQRRERQSPDLRDESEGVHLDVVIDVFAAKEAGKVIIGAREAHIAAELDGVQARRKAQSVGDIEAVLA